MADDKSIPLSGPPAKARWQHAEIGFSADWPHNQVLTCPNCGEGNLHHGTVTVYERREDDDPVHGRRMILDDAAVVGIRPSPWLVTGYLSSPDLQAVSDWVRLNEAALLDYWDFKIDTDEFLQRLRRLP